MIEIKNGDLVFWDGIVPSKPHLLTDNLNALRINHIYKVKTHWFNPDWCMLEGIPFMGFPRSMFTSCACEFEDVIECLK